MKVELKIGASIFYSPVTASHVTEHLLGLWVGEYRGWVVQTVSPV